MEPGPDLPGEEKGPADADGADRIELVGVEEDPGLERPGRAAFPEAVGPDAVDDGLDRGGIAAVALEDPLGQVRAAPAVADPAVGPVLLLAADVVEEGGELEDAEVGLFLSPDPQAEPVDALRVVPVVAAPGAAEERPGLFPDAGDEGRGDGGGHSSIIWTTRPSLSLGSNQVDLGGMTLPASATEKSWSIVVGKKEKATRNWPETDLLLELAGAADAADEIDPLVGPGIGDAEDGRQEVVLEDRDVEGADGIGRVERAGLGLEAVPAAVEEHGVLPAPRRGLRAVGADVEPLADPGQEGRRRRAR